MVPRLVEAEIEKYPYCSQEAKKIMDTRLKQDLDAIIYNETRWPPGFRKLVSDRAAQQAELLKDEAYHADVESGVYWRLQELRNGAWSSFIKDFQDNVMTPRLQNSLRNLVVLFQEVIDVPCPHCGNVNSVLLTPDDLATLVSRKRITLLCSFCTGIWGGSMKFTLSFGNFFYRLTAGYSSAELEPARKAKAKFISLETKNDLVHEESDGEEKEQDGNET